jgi:hypothetical protein
MGAPFENSKIKRRNILANVRRRKGRWFVRSGTVIGWFKSGQREQRRKVRLDRKHLESRSRRFLRNYLSADEKRKPAFYRAVEEASEQCRPGGPGLPPPELEDAKIAEAVSTAAMKIVLERSSQKEKDQTADFVTDGYATVAIAYHRAAGLYTIDKEMEELGTAAVHLLTMATSYTNAQKR